MYDFDQLLDEVVGTQRERDLWKNLANKLTKLIDYFKSDKKPPTKLFEEISVLRAEIKKL